MDPYVRTTAKTVVVLADGACNFVQFWMYRRIDASFYGVCKLRFLNLESSMLWVRGPGYLAKRSERIGRCHNAMREMGASQQMLFRDLERSSSLNDLARHQQLNRTLKVTDAGLQI